MTTIDATREFVGETEEAALEKALTHYGVSRDKLDVRVVPEELGVSGLAGRALLLVSMKGAGAGSAPARSSERGDRERGDRGRDRDRGDRDRDRDRGRGGRRGERRESRDRGERGERTERGERGERSERGEPRSKPEQPLSVESSGVGPIGEFVARVLEHIGRGGTIRVSESSTDDEVLIAVEGDGAEDLAHLQPGLAGAVSHLAHRAAQTEYGEDAYASVDFPGGPARDGGNDSQLEALARETAEAVRESGEPKLLDPMNSRERFVVHNAIRDVDGVTSESVSEGREKRIQVRPE